MSAGYSSGHLHLLARNGGLAIDPGGDVFWSVSNQAADL